MSKSYPTAEEAARAWARKYGTTKESACTGGWIGLAERLKESQNVYPTPKGWSVSHHA